MFSSYLHLAGLDLGVLLAQKSAMHPSRRFLTWEPGEEPARHWTYGEFELAAKSVAAGLQARGVRPGTRVLVHAQNSADMVLAIFGLALAGATAVTTNVRSSVAELADFAERSAAVAAFCSPGGRTVLEAAAPGLSWVVEIGGDAPCGAVGLGSLMCDPAAYSPVEPDPGREFVIQFTSGTTARPKAVVLTQANALWGGSVSAMHQGLRDDDVHLIHLPLFHVNALIYSLMATLWVGAGCVLMPQFSASRFWPISLRNKCTWASMVPFCLRALAAHPVPDVHHYRLWGNAVNAPPPDRHFKVRTIGWWGMTETVSHGIVGSPWLMNRPMSLGRPSPAYGIDVVRDDGSPVAVGESGRLLVRGTPGLSLFKAYLGDPAATAAAFDEKGRFITGDRVTLGDDGSLIFADREKDMLKVGGENVASAEIERVILTVPGVLEVAVIGIPDPLRDEVPLAAIIPAGKAGEALASAVIERCRAELADFKVPRHVRFVDSFPRATLEKIAKAQLRAQLLAEV